VDQVFAEEVVASGAALAAYVPFEGQQSRWPTASQAHYERLLRRACRVRTVSRIPGVEAFHKRNRAMVEDCDVVVAVWNGKQAGGTHHCLTAALEAGRPVVWLDPEARQSVLVA